MQLCFVAVGHCTHESARLLAVVDRIDAPVVELAWRVQGTETWSEKTYDLVSAPPFGLAKIDLAGLTEGATIEYRMKPGRDGSPFFGRFRLPKQNRSPRIAIVSCNKIDNPKIQYARRGLLWRELKHLVTRARWT